MINSSIRMIERKIGINILLSVIIGITILLGVICTSTYDKLTEKTARYSSFTKMYGGVYYFDYGEYERFLSDSEVVPDDFHGVKESLLGVNGTNFRMRAYDNLQSEYKIPLSEGVWYTEADSSEYINVVVTPNECFKVGDIVHPSDYMSDADDELYLKVCGVTVDEFSYLEMNQYPEHGIQELYSNYYVDSPYPYSLMLMSAEDVEQFEGFLYQPFILLGFEDKADAEYVENHSYTYAKYMDMSELREITDRSIEHKMNEVLPIFIVVFLMSIICLVSIVAVETIFDMKAYAIYFISGAKWRAVVSMNAIRCVIVYVFGLGFASLLGLVSKKLMAKQSLIIAIGNKQIIVAVCLFVVFCFSICIAPAVIVRRRTPKEVILKSEE